MEMEINEKFGKLADDKTIMETAEALKANGAEVFIVDSKEDAKKKVLEILPKGAEIMAMPSMTLEEAGIAQEINESGNYNSVRKKLLSMDRKTQGLEMQKIGAAPEWAIGSIHAVAEDGTVMVASKTGSQFPAYAYGSSHIIWVVGAQKIVKNMEEGLERIYEYSLPLENERAKKAYGAESSVNKILVIKNEIAPGRIAMIIVKEKLGF